MAKITSAKATTMPRLVGAVDPKNLEGDGKKAPSEKEIASREAREQRRKDLQAGLASGRQIFQPGGLGRLDEDISGQRQDILDRRRQIAEQGFGAEAFQAARETRLGDLQRQQRQQQQQLQASLAARGLSGGQATAGQLALMGQQQRQRQQAEQDLLLRDVALRQAGLGAFEKSLTQAEQEELAREQFNLAQRRREKLGQTTIGLAEMGLGVSERSAVEQAAVAEAAQQAIAAQAGQGGKK